LLTASTLGGAALHTAARAPACGSPVLPGSAVDEVGGATVPQAARPYLRGRDRIWVGAAVAEAA